MPSDEEFEKMPVRKIGGPVELSSAQENKTEATSVYDEFPCEEFKQLKITSSAAKKTKTASTKKPKQKAATTSKTRSTRGRPLPVFPMESDEENSDPPVELAQDVSFADAIQSSSRHKQQAYSQQNYNFGNTSPFFKFRGFFLIMHLFQNCRRAKIAAKCNS